MIVPLELVDKILDIDTRISIGLKPKKLNLNDFRNIILKHNVMNNHTIFVELNNLKMYSRIGDNGCSVFYIEKKYNDQVIASSYYIFSSDMKIVVYKDNI